MKKVIILIVVVALLAGMGYLVRAALNIVRERREAALIVREEPIPTVVAQLVEEGTLRRYTHITGSARPLASVTVTPKISGNLETFGLPDGRAIEVGERVRRGEVIAIIERDELENAVEQAQAALDVSRARLNAAKIAKQDAQSEKERMNSLFDRGAATEQQFDRAKNAFDRAVAEVALAEAQIAQSRTALDAAEIRLGHATISAPLDGVISRKYVELGDMVGPGSPLITIDDDSHIRIIGSTSEMNLGWIRGGQTPAMVVFDAMPGMEFEGTVERIGATIEPLTRTVEIEIRMSNPERRMMPGMFARVSLVLEERAGVPIIPEGAIVRQDGRMFVYTVNEDEIYVREVETGLTAMGMNEVIDGVQPGDKVVIRRDRLYEGGEKVNVRMIDEVR